MIIGVPGEIKKAENRAGLTPAGVHSFLEPGHQVYIEKDAGVVAAMIWNMHPDRYIEINVN